jgi:hypothetical protein
MTRGTFDLPVIELDLLAGLTDEFIGRGAGIEFESMATDAA